MLNVFSFFFVVFVPFRVTTTTSGHFSYIRVRSVRSLASYTPDRSGGTNPIHVCVVKHETPRK